MMKLTIVVTLVVIVFLTESVEPCDDNLIKRMAVSVCGLDKRSFSTNNDWPVFQLFGLNLRNVGGIEHQYKQLIGDARVDETELLTKTSEKRKPKGSNARQRPSHFWPIYKDEIAGFGSIPLSELDYNDGQSFVRKRDIVTLVKECCYKVCTIEDFKGICDKK